MSSGSSPYQSPNYYSQQFQPPKRVPAVWYWYVTYCVAMLLLYLACAAGGAALLGFAEELAADDPDMSASEARVMGVVFVAISIPLILMYGAAPLLPKGKVAWILGIVNIAIGLTSACCLPVCIPLLIFWLKPEMKEFMNAA